MTMLGRHPALAAGLVIGPVMALASLLGGGSVLGAAVSLAVVIGYALIVSLLARRGDTFEILAGTPEDERGGHPTA
jgi:hypothetical protein